MTVEPQPLEARSDAPDLLDWFFGSSRPRQVPEEHAEAFAPATHWVYEWEECLLECRGADRLRIGATTVRPVGERHFRVVFQNALGLARLQPFDGGRPLAEPLVVEVLSPKFGRPTEHRWFYGRLLDDLFARAARLPFTFTGPTARGVAEALRPPAPLFVLHFLCHHAAALRTALSWIEAAPYRQLRDRSAMLPLAQAAEVDAGVVTSLLSTGEAWVPAHGFPLAERLGGRVPARLLQRLPEETCDTPENRLLKHFLRRLVAAAEALERERWWPNVAPERQAIVRSTAARVRRSLRGPVFDEVGTMERVPLGSLVLLRRDGYRELLRLWRVFQHARRPLFGRLAEAIEVRDIALLYEMWVFFALTERIGAGLDVDPVIELRGSQERGLGGRSIARFGDHGELLYNQDQRGYSVLLRPDFTWVRDGRPVAVLDAKFRFDRGALESGGEDRGRRPRPGRTSTRCTLTRTLSACQPQSASIRGVWPCSTIRTAANAGRTSPWASC